VDSFFALLDKCLVSLHTGLKVVGTSNQLLSARDDLPLLASSLLLLQQLHFAGGFTQLQRAQPDVQVGCVIAHCVLCLLIKFKSFCQQCSCSSCTSWRLQLCPAGLMIAGRAA
jgi:hypothetical protein